MPEPLRILFVAEAAAAVEALAAVREGGPVQAQLAPSADILRTTLAGPEAASAWDAVVFVPGAPVEEVEVAVYVPDALPLFVVDDEVPLLLTETTAVAVPLSELATLHDRLASAPGSAPAAPAPLPEASPSAEAPAGAATPESATPVELPPPVPTAPTPAASAAGPLRRVETAPEPVEDAGDAPAADEPSPVPAAEHPPEDEAEEGAMPADLASLADHLTVGLYRSSPDGRILYANPALAELLGVGSVADLATIDVQADLGYPREAFAAEVDEAGVVRNLIVSWRRPTGERVHTRENARCITDAAGRLVAYEGTMEDVTAEVEGRREEQAVARQHRAVAAFAAAAALSDDSATIHCAAAGALLDATGAEWACLAVRDADQNRIVATAGAFPQGLEDLYHSTPALTGRALSTGPLTVSSVAELDVPAEVGDQLAAAGVGALGSVPVQKVGETLGVLVWGRAAGGEISPAEVRGAEALAWHVGGHLARASAVQALRDTQASLAAIAEHTPHVLYRLRYTPDGPAYDYLSPAIETLTGLTRAEIEARGGPGALIEYRDVVEGEGLATRPVDGAEHYRAFYRMATAHGVRWVENSARLWRDAAGRPVGLVGALQDVTDRKQREDQLADTAQTALIRQRALVDLAHLDGADAFGGPAAAVVAATLGASDVSFWVCESGRPCDPLHAPPPVDPDAGFEEAFAPVLAHVAQHRALAVADVTADPRVEELALGPFVQTYGLRALLVAPIRRQGRVAGLVAVHRTDGPHEWDGAETEFAAAVADAVALALEREDRERVVAELLEAREAAEAGRAAAERMNRLKSAFLANMSHEIRTPLTGILGFADLLADEVPEPQQEFVGLIERNGRRLLDTLNAVLDLSRLEAGEYEADLRPTALADEVRAASERYAEEARAKGLRFDLDLDPDVAADVDVPALHQIVGHVVGNAIKFTDAGGVLVTVEGTSEEALLRIADTGCGISEEFLPEVLDAFRQEDVGHARSHEGSGLGLTIARRLAHLLGGRIEIASEQPGGTVVTLTFPRVDPPDVPRAGRPAVERREPAPSGDSVASDDVEVRPSLVVPALPPPSDPGDLLGQPFDFTFLTAPAAEAAPPDAHETPSPDTPDMFDFRFGRSPASDPLPAPRAAPVAPEAAAPRAAPQAVPPAAPHVAPLTTPGLTSPAPSAPPAGGPHEPSVPAWGPPTQAGADEPVMIVRPKGTPAPPTIPQVPDSRAEDAEVVDEPAGDGRPTVLVVEDNDDTRMLLERILRSTYDVTAVGDARSALLAMNQRRFSCLVLDINLGGKETGADVLRIARSLPRYDGVFAIALTAYALPGDRERLLESGFNAYISKPFTRQSLMETLAGGVAA